MDNSNNFGNMPLTQPSFNNAPKNTSPVAVWVVLGISIILAIIGIGIGISGMTKADKAIGAIEGVFDASVDELQSGIVQTEEEIDELACVLPSSVEDIEYISVSKVGEERFDVSNEGFVDFYTYGEDASGNDTESSVTVVTDTSSIMQYVYNNDLNNFSGAINEEADDWVWSVQIGNENSYCAVGGSQTAPVWFNNLVENIKAKRDS